MLPTLYTKLCFIPHLAFKLQGEGCSFRGRALVELTVNIGQEPGKDELIRDIDSEDLLRVQPFQRRRRYRLFVGFLEGTMIHPVDAPVEFEISIGEQNNPHLLF